MVYLIVTMLVILVICAGVVLYAAYPHRGESIPAVPWLGRAMARAAEKVPTVEPVETEERSMDFHR
ncbi:MAG TPA: hypothetical protein VMF51_22695 [Nocardioides sp.]|uniref:hypothetical protein n=1 Tax=Nocardioides sp. TaxID=35761 RepID=UPI002CFAF122|nr:hypothetical protein [Nocardioides sp.]HTW17952.1 hypothetical protein [Nocardioides sp.]